MTEFRVINPLSNETYLKRTREKTFEMRGDYFRDQTALIHSMPFRRLKHKTQVFFAPENDHVCTRIEHVMHVATIAATICKGLRANNWDLDVELAYAIGLGHDLGHAPFGHAGEDALNKRLGGGTSFIHEVNGYRVVEYLANDGNGLNLTYAVKDGIICHNGEEFEDTIKPSLQQNDLDSIKDRKCKPSSWEGCIVRFADKIAYLGRDIEDAIIAKIIQIDDVPADVRTQLGNKNGQIIESLIVDLIESSKDKDEIMFSLDKHKLMVQLKNFNYKYIYNSDNIRTYKQFGQKIVSELFDYLCTLFCRYGKDFSAYQRSNIKLDKQFGRYLEKMDSFYKNEGDIPNRMVIDYVAGMTDLYALECMKQISLPSPLYFQ